MHSNIEFNILGMGFELKTYPLFIIISMIIGFILSLYSLKKSKFKIGFIIKVYLGICITFLIGARVLNYILKFEDYQKLGISIWKFQFGYFSLYGGIIFSTIFLIVYLKFKKISILAFLDKLIIPFLISFFVMKWGCFLNGCCYGKSYTDIFATSLPLVELEKYNELKNTITFMPKIPLTVYPTQLMEGFGALFIGGILYYRIKKKIYDKREGILFLEGTVYFTILRWIVFYFRDLHYSKVILNFVYPVLYFFIIIGCIFFMRRRD